MGLRANKHQGLLGLSEAGRGKEGFSPPAFTGIMAPLTPQFQTWPPEGQENNLLLVETSQSAVLLSQQQETHTG